jgi:hypothetical protein
VGRGVLVGVGAGADEFGEGVGLGTAEDVGSVGHFADLVQLVDCAAELLEEVHPILLYTNFSGLVSI